LALFTSLLTAFYFRGGEGASENSKITTSEVRKPGLDFGKIRKEYSLRLQSGDAKVVESALETLIYIRIAFPNEDLQQLEPDLYGLAYKGATRAIRYKAYLALQVYSDPGMFRDAVESRHLTGGEFYERLAEKIRR
jgi:hypothetical protein